MDRKNLFLPFVFLLLLSCSSKKGRDEEARPSNEYFYHVDCQLLMDDKLTVEVVPPKINNDKILFCFPKIVPGIYGNINFGKYVEDFEALDADNVQLTAEKIDTNCWQINDAKKLSKITYKVNDGWEEFSYNTERLYFSAESTFKDDEVFLINNNSLFGYLEQYEDLPVNVKITKPENQYVATTLKKIVEDQQYVLLKANDYLHLVDNPIMISKPDTTRLVLGDIEVTVAAYSTSKEKISRDIALEIEPLLKNQKDYLGGILPVTKYTFLVYHNLNELEGHFVGDGLEHSNSTVILLNMPAEKSVICETVYGIASHEFFHTITPLAIHSEEIENYDFNDPKMSRHLWFYEGMTEYFTIHMPVKQGLQPVNEFLRVCQGKIFAMRKFDNSIPLTQLSENVLQRPSEFYNFYIKGALTCLLFDIKLREWSGGSYGAQNLVLDLMNDYGKDRPFKDQEFFEKIVELTDPSMEDFIQKYLAGNHPLPLKEYFFKAGIDLTDQPLSLQLVSDPTKEQLALRKSWLNN